MHTNTVVTPERRDSMVLASGRTLDWSEWGPLNGYPVIFCTGAGMSGSLGFGADALNALNVRLMALDRPGLGRSSNDPSKSFFSWVDDLRQLISERGLGRPAALGFSQGAPFALALAHAGLLSNVSIVSGQDDLTYSGFTGMISAQVAGLLEHNRTDPSGLERHIAGTATAEWLWNMVVHMSGEIDREFYTTEPFAQFYRACLEEGFAQGAEGYARDLVLTMGKWPFDLETIEVPVSLWFGAKDASPVHSPDFGATMAKRIPKASRTIDPHLGSAILWIRAMDILNDLVSRRDPQN